MTKPILLLFTHPYPRRSRANSALLSAISDLEGVTVHDLYQQYPDFLINVKKEQRLLLNHHTIVLQHPFYWYSVPALLKEWLDAVLEDGWAYGNNGANLVGKQLLQVITTGGPADSYHPEGYNFFNMEDLLKPMVQTARLCGMEYLPPFITHAANRCTDLELDAQCQRYRTLITKMLAQSQSAEKK